jgi:hypothetical protein
MPVAKISGQGLFAIACSVALLWSYLIGERVMHIAAHRLHEFHWMEQWRRTPDPTPAISPAAVRRPTVALG